MGNYKEKNVYKPFIKPEGWVCPPIRVSYPLYRVLAKYLKAEGVAPLSRLEVIVPEEDEE